MQYIDLASPQCMYLPTVIHELLHALGLKHMHNSSDRDNFIRIDFNNIQRKYVDSFKKVKSTDHSYFGTTYDLLSIMHYGKYEFAIDKEKRTIYVEVSAFIMLFLVVSNIYYHNVLI